MNDNKYLFGLTLILISFVACVVSFWLLIFGVPIFVAGTILVLFSRVTAKKKLIVTILPIVLYFPTTYLFLFAYNYSTPKTFIIPDSYEGPIRIVYNENCGTKYFKKNGNLTLVFPDNGILILNEKFDGGVNNRYFLLSRNGQKKLIKGYVGFEKESKKTPYILIGGSGSFGSSGQGKLPFQTFTSLTGTLLNKKTEDVQTYSTA
jgi:hypothetical protein